MEDNKMGLADNGAAENNESMNNENVNQNSGMEQNITLDDTSKEVAEESAEVEGSLPADSNSDSGGNNSFKLSTVTGFKAVDVNGNETMVSKDELVNAVMENILMNLNAQNGIMTLEEKSTLSATAASGTDEYENQLPVMNDCSHVRVLDSSGNPGLMTKQKNAEVVGGLIGNLGLFPFMYRGQLKSNNEVDNAKNSGVYHVNGDGTVNVIPDYSMMIVFKTLPGYLIQLVFRMGSDVIGYRRNTYNQGWNNFK